MLRVVRVVAAAGAVGTVVAAVDASTQICSDGHTPSTAANQYILHRAMGAIGNPHLIAATVSAVC